jgi:hypothetical protein
VCISGKPERPALAMVRCPLAYRASVRQFRAREIISLSGSRMSFYASSASIPL